MRRPKDTYVKEAAELLGIRDGNPAELPADKATEDLGGDLVGAADATLFRTSMGKLACVQDDLVMQQHSW